MWYFVSHQVLLTGPNPNWVSGAPHTQISSIPEASSFSITTFPNSTFHNYDQQQPVMSQSQGKIFLNPIQLKIR